MIRNLSKGKPEQEDRAAAAMLQDCSISDDRTTNLIPSRALAEQVFSRAAGAPLIPGTRIRLLVDAGENYPAWIDGLESATRSIHFEMYIIHEDQTGLQFAEILMAKARQGVRVRLLYDWMGV
jgi:cardiolipin synthase